MIDDSRVTCLKLCDERDFSLGFQRLWPESSDHVLIVSRHYAYASICYLHLLAVE